MDLQKSSGDPPEQRQAQRQAQGAVRGSNQEVEDAGDTASVMHASSMDWTGSIAATSSLPEQFSVKPSPMSQIVTELMNSHVIQKSNQIMEWIGGDNDQEKEEGRCELFLGVTTKMGKKGQEEDENDVGVVVVELSKTGTVVAQSNQVSAWSSFDNNDDKEGAASTSLAALSAPPLYRGRPISTPTQPGAFQVTPTFPSEGRRVNNRPPSNVEITENATRTLEDPDFVLDDLEMAAEPSSTNNVILEATLVEEDRNLLAQQIRDEFFNAAVKGEEVSATEPSSPKKKISFFFILILVVGIGIVVVAVVTNNQKETKIVVPTTLQPTETTMPSMAPTDRPSSQPSVAPSISIANLDNRIIEEAHPLTLRTATPLTGNLSRVADQLFAYDCGHMEVMDQTGIWYVYEPRASGPVHMVLCGVAAYIMVFQADQAFNFTCYDVADEDIGNCGGTSFSWNAEIETYYYALISPPIDTSTGNDTIFDEENDNFTIQIVDNDQCQYAAGPIIPTGSGAVLSYTTIHAELDIEAFTCGGASASTSPGVWYQVQGTGQAITASTCSDETTFDTQVSVFRGVCGSFECVNGNSDFCGTQSTVVWPSHSNEMYYVLVHGANATSAGAFTLTVSTDVPRKDNDFCASATRVEEGSNLTFSFSGSWADPDLPLCGEDGSAIVDAGTAEFPHGIWYSIVGTGLTIAVTVSSATISPVTMNIYSGSSCGGLSCEANQRYSSCVGSPEFLQCSDMACIQTTQGQVYYVLVSTKSLDSINEEQLLEVGSCR